MVVVLWFPFKLPQKIYLQTHTHTHPAIQGTRFGATKGKLAILVLPQF